MDNETRMGEEPDEPGEKDCEGGHCDIQTKWPGLVRWRFYTGIDIPIKLARLDLAWNGKKPN